MKRSLALVVGLGFLTACGGGSSTTPGTPAKAQSQSVSGSVVISIPLAGGQSTSARVRYPQFVSPNASSITVSINGGAAQLFDVAAGSSLCVTTTTARNCTLTLGAPVGSDTFALLIFAGAGGTGAQLASASTTQPIAAGVAFNFTVAMNAAIGTVIANIPTTGGTQSNCPDGPGTFNGVFEGCAGSSGNATFAVLDPSGATITGTAPFATPITISTNDPSVTASPNQITAPGQTVNFTYTGAPLGAAITNTLTVNLTIGTVVIPATVPVRRSYLYVANSNAVNGNGGNDDAVKRNAADDGTPTGGGNIAVYTYGASGAPTRTIAGASTQLSNPLDVKLDASDELYVLDNNPYATSPTPVINVYAPGASGNAAPIRRITGLAAVTSNAACESLIFDPTGQYVMVVCGDALIHVFPATGNGLASSVQVAELGSRVFQFPVSAAFDTQGNLYVTDPETNSSEGSIFYFPGPINPAVTNLSLTPGVTMKPPTGWPATPGLAPIGLAFDNAGTLFASVLYFNLTKGPADAQAEIAMWQTTSMPSIPCNCAPTSTLTGAPFTTHASAAMAIDPPGNLYVSNAFTNQINVFSRATVTAAGINPPVLRTINTGANPSAPNGMVVGP
jgi:hypothetical protein